MSAKKVEQLRRRQMVLLREVDAGNVRADRAQVIGNQARRLELEIRRINGDKLPEMPIAERIKRRD